MLSAADGYRRWAPSYGEPPNPFQRLEEEALRRLLPDVRGLSVLDAGCGRGRTGHIALERGAARAVGLDASIAMLARADTGARSRRLVAARVEHLPLRRGAFDIVLCALVLGHVEDLRPAVGGLCDVLRPGGRLLVSDFHPAATARGLQRTFSDTECGCTFAIEQHVHPLEEYSHCLEQEKLVIEELCEPKWKGERILFVIRARKAASGAAIAR